MTLSLNPSGHAPGLTLVTGGTGKTGARIIRRLEAKGAPARLGSRAAQPAFDWDKPSGWDACLDGVEAVYIAYAGDLAAPGAQETIAAFIDAARAQGVRRLVLLSGRGEPEAQACEGLVRGSGLEWTILRASWFNQNFSESAFAGFVHAGKIALPVGEVREPFVDADDIADAAVAALTEPGHAGALYELTGPRLLSFPDIAAALSEATGRPIAFERVEHGAFLEGMRAAGVPADMVAMLDYLFGTVLDGRNATLTDGVERALGRPAKDFAAYARDAAAAGAWRAVA